MVLWKARVSGYSNISGNAHVAGDVIILGGRVSNNASIFGCAKVTGNPRIFGNVKLHDFAHVSEDARLHGDAVVAGNARVYGSASVFGDSIVIDYAQVGGHARVCDRSKICGNAQVFGISFVGGNAVIKLGGVVCQDMAVPFGYVTKDLSNRDNLNMNIQAQTNLLPTSTFVYAYKHVESDLSSLYDNNFKYVVGEWAEADNPEMSDDVCAAGLHVSHPSHWNGQDGKNIILCMVMLDDIITVQRGKIRCKRLFVEEVCVGDVF
jgi:carbonic anhydrase/acetyltransferase-like protein (isoleucine patch superfamily)